jgi:NAD(P)-dependent dehydrogenase (short-subunit alcohol dehydrogenase family)
MSLGVCVITGASRGIGAACARQAASAGYDVLVNFVHDEQAAENVARAVRETGRKAVTVQGDVGVAADVERIFDAADSLGKVTGLVNNAGIVAPRQRVDEYSPERLEQMFRVNITGSFLCAAAAVKRMSTNQGGNGGAIVNLGSIAAVLGGAGQYVDYAASKGAIDVLTIGLAREVAEEGIRVNALRPGIIDTEIHASGGQPDRVAQMRGAVPMKREGSADEVANAVIWLLSDKASYVTGTLMDVSGGR